MQNIAETRSNGARAQAGPGDRPNLKLMLLDEMTAWPAGDRGGAFRAWHRHALSLVHLNVLTLLEADGPLSMRRLAEAMDVSDASVTGIVDRMEKRGLVERRRGTDDRRVVLVHATEAGGNVFEDLAAHRREMLSRVLDQLSEDEMAALLTGMKAIHAARIRVLAARAETTAASPPPPGSTP